MRSIALKLICLVVLTATASSCVALGLAAAGGAAGAVYAKGRLTDIIEAPIENVYPATIAAAEADGILIEEKQGDLGSARIEGKYPDNRPILITMDAMSTNVTKIRIRIGPAGAKDRSTLLLNDIKNRL